MVQAKEIKGFKNYWITTKGDIYLHKKKSAKRYNLGERFRKLACSIGSRGYRVITLRKNNKNYWRTVHRLVGETFIPNPEDKPQLNHIDGDKTNNDIGNLEWVTPSENMAHAIQTGLKKGMKNINMKPVLQYDKNGDFIQEFPSAIIAIQSLGKSNPSPINNCRNGHSKTSYGYIWKHRT